jgi:hypothetical protein
MLLNFLCIVVATLCLFSSSVPTINDGLIFKKAAAAQVDTTIAQESYAADSRTLRRNDLRRDRYHKKKIAKTTACPSEPTESSLSSSSSGT